MKNSKLIKALKITSIVIVSLILIASAALGGYIANRIAYQNEEKDTHDNSIKQLEVWNYDLDGFNARFTGRDITATAEDGNRVPGTWFENGSKSCAILVHGAGGDRVCTWPLAEAYLLRGYDVIAIDQRGCGSNPDKKVTFGIKEAYDVAAMVRYARNELGMDTVIVHGQSMGAQTTALYASGVNAGDEDAADAVICDSPVPGMELMLRYMFGDGEEGAYSPVTNYLIFTSKVMSKLMYGINFDDGDTIARASRIDIPVMIIVSEKDEVCLPALVEKIYDNITCKDKAIAYVDSAHIEGVIDDPEGYMNTVEGFLGTVVQ